MILLVLAVSSSEAVRRRSMLPYAGLGDDDPVLPMTALPLMLDDGGSVVVSWTSAGRGERAG